MLSEGRAGIDNVYSLKEGRYPEFLVSEQLIQIVIGILTLHLDKESYERAGIVGKPEGVKGTRGTKPRWSMLTKTEENIIELLTVQ
jgi:ribonuclease P/MRP protein subunit RPP40